MLDANDIILAHMHEHEGRISVEAASLVLSRELGTYTSEREAQGILEALKMQGMAIYNAPTEYCSRSAYPYFILTAKGHDAAKQSHGKAWDQVAFELWLTSEV